MLPLDGYPRRRLFDLNRRSAAIGSLTIVLLDKLEVLFLAGVDVALQ